MTHRDILINGALDIALELKHIPGVKLHTSVEADKVEVSVFVNYISPTREIVSLYPLQSKSGSATRARVGYAFCGVELALSNGCDIDLSNIGSLSASDVRSARIFVEHFNGVGIAIRVPEFTEDAPSGEFKRVEVVREGDDLPVVKDIPTWVVADDYLASDIELLLEETCDRAVGLTEWIVLKNTEAMAAARESPPVDLTI